MAKIEYINFDKSGINRIRELWEGLNKHHFERSVNFKERYAKMTFEKRKELLFNKLGNGNMFIELALDSVSEKPVGYCLSIITKSGDMEGEIESLFIIPSYRKKGIGEAFIQHALEWLDSNKVSSKRIIVAAGNEEIFPFYEKFGFFPKFITLEK
jgi:ribosomal protein S18 acetylase RimI-like enzyme